MIEDILTYTWGMFMSGRPRERQGELEELQENATPLDSPEPPGGATNDVTCRLFFHNNSAGKTVADAPNGVQHRCPRVAIPRNNNHHPRTHRLPRLGSGHKTDRRASGTLVVQISCGVAALPAVDTLP